jgi:hypothetical protein
MSHPAGGSRRPRRRSAWMSRSWLPANASWARTTPTPCNRAATSPAPTRPRAAPANHYANPQPVDVDSRTGIRTRSDQFVTSPVFRSAVRSSPENRGVVNPCGSHPARTRTGSGSAAPPYYQMVSSSLGSMGASTTTVH